MPLHNAPAIKLITDRYSHHVKAFNYTAGLAQEDSDQHFDLMRELSELATAALIRAPKVEPTGTRMALLAAYDLGNIRIAMRRAFTDAERARYDEIQEELEAIAEKYED